VPVSGSLSRALRTALPCLALGACVMPFATPPIKAEVGAASNRTGEAPSASLIQVAVGSHLASGTHSRNQPYDLGIGWVFQHDFTTEGPSTTNGLYLDGAMFIDRRSSSRTSAGVRSELLWMPGGLAVAAKLRIDHELFRPVSSPFSSHDHCGSASGHQYGTAAIGLFTEAGAVRTPEGVTAFTATAGLTFRLPSAMGVWIGIPYCK